VDSYLEDGRNTYDDKWTKSIAVGSNSLVDKIKSLMGSMAIGRKIVESGDSHQLREPAAPYMAHLGAKKNDIEAENTYF
jgi:putative transposase